MNIRSLGAGFVMGAVLFTTLSIAIAWTGPSSAPPNGNVSAPINTGMTNQVKNGGLSVNTLAVFGNGTLTGNFGINTTNPAYHLDVNGVARIVGDLVLSGAARYLNFGTATGTNGYGFRDNAGVMQFKNSGGSWTSIPATATIPSGTLCGARVARCGGLGPGQSGPVYDSNSSTAVPCNGTTITATCSGVTPVVSCPSGYSAGRLVISVDNGYFGDTGHWHIFCIKT